MKYETLSSVVQVPVFSRSDIPPHQGTLYDYQLTRWVRKGYLLKLKNGVYAFAREAGRIKGEEVATLLYEPSYLSLESALSHYGIIPEMVFAYVSVTPKITRTFGNALGRFVYRHVKSALFWGYSEVKTETGRFLMAEPEKAVLDYLYLNLAKINSEEDYMNLRFNEDRLRETLDREKFHRYLKAFDVKKMERWAQRCLP